MVEARHQAFVAADGSGRADGSRHQRSFGSGSRLPKTDSVRPELRAYSRGPKNGINLSQTNAKTSQHQRLRPATKMRTTLRTIRKPAPISVASACARLLVSLGVGEGPQCHESVMPGVDGGQNVVGDIVGWVHRSAVHRDDDPRP